MNGFIFLKNNDWCHQGGGGARGTPFFCYEMIRPYFIYVIYLI
jgi:hypothetical protein